MKEALEGLVGKGGELDRFKEAYFEELVSIAGSFEGGRLEKVSTKRMKGISLRNVEGDLVRFGSTSFLDRTSIQELASNVLGFKGSFTGFPDKESLDIFDPSPMLSFLAELYRSIWGSTRFLKQVRLSFSQAVKRVVVANSIGTVSEDRRPYFTLLLELVGEREGYVQTFRESYGGTFLFKDASEDEIEKRFSTALRKLDSLLSAPSSPKGRMPVVIAGEAGGTLIHEAVGHGLEADLVYKKVSVYRERLGEKVASDKVTVVDDPTLGGMRGSYSFDDEGTKARRNVLIENGILRGYLSDLVHLRKVKGALPGNGRRESYKNIPIPRMSNTFIEKGNDSLECMIKDVEKGLYVKKMGGGQVNTVNGDFVFDVLECYLIEKGTISHMVKGATLLGNGPKVLMDIDKVGSDLGFSIGTCGKDGQGVPVSDGQPTVRIPEILIGGRN